MKTKYLKVIDSERDIFNYDGYGTDVIPITMSTMNELIDKLKRFVLGRVKNLIDKHGVSGELLYFINVQYDMYFASKIKICESELCKFAYLDISLPSPIGDKEKAIQRIFIEKINNMMASLDCFKPEEVMNYDL